MQFEFHEIPWHRILKIGCPGIDLDFFDSPFVPGSAYNGKLLSRVQQAGLRKCEFSLSYVSRDNKIGRSQQIRRAGTRVRGHWHAFGIRIKVRFLIDVLVSIGFGGCPGDSHLRWPYGRNEIIL